MESRVVLQALLESEDIMSLITEQLDPTSIVALGRVSRDVRAQPCEWPSVDHPACSCGRRATRGR